MGGSNKNKDREAERAGRTRGRRRTAPCRRLRAVTALPALAEARSRLLGLCDTPASSLERARRGGRVRRRAGDRGHARRQQRRRPVGPHRRGPRGDRVAERRAASKRLRPVSRPTTSSRPPGVTADRWERFRRHGVAVRVGTERIGELARLPQRDELAIAALLHDVGKLVIVQLYGETTPSDRGSRDPRGARAQRAPRARHRSRAGRRRPRPPLGPAAGDRHRDRAPSLARRERPRRRDPPRRPDRPPRRRRPGLDRRHARDRRPSSTSTSRR